MWFIYWVSQKLDYRDFSDGIQSDCVWLHNDSLKQTQGHKGYIEGAVPLSPIRGFNVCPRLGRDCPFWGQTTKWGL